MGKCDKSSFYNVQGFEGLGVIQVNTFRLYGLYYIKVRNMRS
jgi:hypothetical protein